MSSSNFFKESTERHRQKQGDIRATAVKYLKQRMVRATALTVPERIPLNVALSAEKDLLTNEVYRRVDTVELFITAREIVKNAPGLLVGVTRSKLIAILLSNGTPPIDIRRVIELKRTGFVFAEDL